jgi:hypothetical protein
MHELKEKRKDNAETLNNAEERRVGKVKVRGVPEPACKCGGEPLRCCAHA